MGVAMAVEKVRVTLFMEPELSAALRMEAALRGESHTDLAMQLLRDSLGEQLQVVRNRKGSEGKKKPKSE